MVVKKNKKNLLTIVLLTIIFIIPMILAWFSYANGFFLSGKTVNRGTLLVPPFSVEKLSLIEEGTPFKTQGKWWLIYLTENPHDKLTARSLYYMRQIRQATGKDRERIERALITIKPPKEIKTWLDKNYPGTYCFATSSDKLLQLKVSLPKKLALEKGSLYLVDPHGNIMLFYDSDAAPKAILKDLQHVLKVSQIG